MICMILFQFAYSLCDLVQIKASGLMVAETERRTRNQGKLMQNDLGMISRDSRFGPSSAAVLPEAKNLRRSRPTMKKMLTLLFAMFVVLSLTMPVFANGTGQEDTTTTGKTKKTKKTKKSKTTGTTESTKTTS